MSVSHNHTDDAKNSFVKHVILLIHWHCQFGHKPESVSLHSQPAQSIAGVYFWCIMIHDIEEHLGILFLYQINLYSYTSEQLLSYLLSPSLSLAIVTLVYIPVASSFHVLLFWSPFAILLLPLINVYQLLSLVLAMYSHRPLEVVMVDPLIPKTLFTRNVPYMLVKAALFHFWQLLLLIPLPFLWEKCVHAIGGTLLAPACEFHKKCLQKLVYWLIMTAAKLKFASSLLYSKAFTSRQCRWWFTVVISVWMYEACAWINCQWTCLISQIPDHVNSASIYKGSCLLGSLCSNPHQL